MLKEDFNDPDTMREHAASLYEAARQAKRMLLKVNVDPIRSNVVKYKGAIQFLDNIIDELTFED